MLLNHVESANTCTPVYSLQMGSRCYVVQHRGRPCLAVFDHLPSVRWALRTLHDRMEHQADTMRVIEHDTDAHADTHVLVVAAMTPMRSPTTMSLVHALEIRQWDEWQDLRRYTAYHDLDMLMLRTHIYDPPALVFRAEHYASSPDWDTQADRLDAQWCLP